MQTVSVKKLLLAFQAQRGAELYGASQWEKLWAFNIRPNLSDTKLKPYNSISVNFVQNFL